MNVYVVPRTRIWLSEEEVAAEASSPEMLRRQAEALMLPADAIKRVTATIVAAPDPEPVRSV